MCILRLVVLDAVLVKMMFSLADKAINELHVAKIRQQHLKEGQLVFQNKYI